MLYHTTFLICSLSEISKNSEKLNVALRAQASSCVKQTVVRYLHIGHFKDILSTFLRFWSPFVLMTKQLQPLWFCMSLTGSCLWRGEISFIFFRTSSLFPLLSLKFKCQPARERVGDREREDKLRSAGRKPLKTHMHTSPIQPDELLKSKMTFCNNTLYSGKV